MPLPKRSEIEWVTVDCYGTLIDWDKGISEAFERVAAEDGLTIDMKTLLPRFYELQYEVMGGSYELYAEVLRQTAIRIAKEIGWDLEPSRSGFLPDSLPRWLPFKETNTQMKKFLAKYQTGLISNIDDKLLGFSRRHVPADVDLVVTAQQVRSYKPEPAHFKECARRIGKKKGWVHITSGHYTDVEPLTKMRVPVIWINRRGQKLDSSDKKPTSTVKNLRDAAKKLGC